jgi:RHS repeat-associated protein
VTGNNKVWRKFTFSPITTSKIRVWINQVPDSWSRVVEIQAFGTSAGGEKVQWLVPDHLGTPRIILDQTGSRANVKRHDYLPFGEELFAGTGGRTAALGYAADGVRQQFTFKERDTETGLDYFAARYYSNTQGRFTSADPFSIILLRQNSKTEANLQAFNQFLGDPRRWNRFAYTVNSPLVFTDKTGLDIMVIENHSTKGNPIGHTAIAITGHGVYSMGNAESTDRSDRKVRNNIVGGSVSEYINREAGRRSTTIIIIKTTPEQDAAALKQLRKDANDPRQLTKGDIASENCSTRSNAALDAAGITTPMEPPIAAMPGSAGWRAAMQDGAQVISLDQGVTFSYLKDNEKQLIQQFEPTASNDVYREMMPPPKPRQMRRRDDIKP